MGNYQVEMALISYLMSYPNFSTLSKEEQWRISIEKRKELVELFEEDKTILNTPQDLYV